MTLTPIRRSGPTSPGASRELGRGRSLPAWPLTGMLILYPVWWLLGVSDILWIAMGSVMALLLARHDRVRAPRGFGLWLLFLVWVVLSASQLDTLGRAVGYTYRLGHYMAATILILYIYNARQQLTERVVTGALTILWIVTVIGGFLGMSLKGVEFRTPLSFIVPPSIASNDLVHHMVVRRFAQYDPTGWVVIDPRPSAPFLFTNNWGNAYSFLLPIVIAYMFHIKGTRRFWWLSVLIIASVFPALATSNRGMFLGIGVAAGYLAVRYLIMGNPWVLVAVVLVTGVAAVGVTQFGAGSGITSRVEQSDTTDDRLEIYQQTLEQVAESPLLGWGAPRPSENPNIPPVGTHGQFWIALHSHGVPAAIFLTAFLTRALLQAQRRRDATGVLAGSVVLVALLESLYYGFMPTGLHLLAIIGALAMRPPDGAPHGAAKQPAEHYVRKRQSVGEGNR